MAIYGWLRSIFSNFKRQQVCPVTYNVNLTKIPKHVRKIISVLKESGYDAFIVGGGVRDLILNLQPKDFDIVTNARPNQIRALFKRSIIIGKRFRLVHVKYGSGRDDFIEVATYRSSSKLNCFSWSKYNKNNNYGDVITDAQRRDFTINSLLYDPDKELLLDYTGGYLHLQDKTICIIGNPLVRFKDDPVRILRAVRFAAKLNFEMEANLKNSIIKNAKLISYANTDRMYLEVIKLFYSGHGVASWQLIKQYGLMKYLFPDLFSMLNGAENNDFEKLFFRVFQQSDHRFKQNNHLSNAFLFAVLYWPLWQNAKKQHKPKRRLLKRRLMQEVLHKSRKNIALSNRVCDAIISIWELQGMLHKHCFSITAYKIIDSSRFRAAMDFYLLRSQAANASATKAKWWQEFSDADDETKKTMFLVD